MISAAFSTLTSSSNCDCFGHDGMRRDEGVGYFKGLQGFFVRVFFDECFQAVALGVAKFQIIKQGQHLRRIKISGVAGFQIEFDGGRRV